MILRLICYDIEDDRLRLKIAKKLESFGFYRIQKSVFCGQHNDVHWSRCVMDLEVMYEKYKKPGDSIYAMVIGKKMLEKVYTLGEQIDTETILDKKLVLWI
ncbi:MAG: CRISPR-associated endonuclease Cas2 [Saprospiraceae bacterium]|nr:CRISPR-associated endonuclease Cas2 [Saprospiraceae bacterium]